MKILFRTDSSLAIGSGHVMRCMTLARALRESGAQVKFICRDLDGNYIRHIKEQGFEVFILEKKTSQLGVNLGLYEKWLSVSEDEDARETEIIFQKIKPDWLIVDHYGISDRWEKKMRPSAKRIMAIDDLANRSHQCDLLLDQNYYPNSATRYMGKVPSECKLLLGPQFAIVRPEFNQVLSKSGNGHIKKVLIFFGAVDPLNETQKVLEAFKKLNSYSFDITVVVGDVNPNKKSLEKLCASMKNVKFYCQYEDMHSLMMNADLFIGAGGTTTWERCLMGLPAITISVADNQFETSRALGHYGACLFLGASNEVSSENISDALNKLLESPSSVLKIATQAQSLMGRENFKGTQGVVDTIRDHTARVAA